MSSILSLHYLQSVYGCNVDGCSCCAAHCASTLNEMCYLNKGLLACSTHPTCTRCVMMVCNQEISVQSQACCLRSVSMKHCYFRNCNGPSRAFLHHLDHDEFTVPQFVSTCIESNIQQSVTAVRGIGSVLSSRLTGGHLHICAVKEQRADGGSEVKCIELKLHFTAVQPSRPLILLQRAFILLICPELRRQEAPAWRGEVGFTSVRLIIWYHLGLSAHLLKVNISHRQCGDFTAHMKSFSGSFLKPEGGGAAVRSIQKLLGGWRVFVVCKTKREMQWWPVVCVWRCKSSVVFLAIDKVPPEREREKLRSGFVDSGCWLNVNPVLLPRTPNHCSVFVQKTWKQVFLAETTVQILTDGFYHLIIKLPAVSGQKTDYLSVTSGDAFNNHSGCLEWFIPYS